MATVTSKDGTHIAFDKTGTGPAVILVGGAFQYRAFDPRTAELAQALAATGFTAYNYDRRGRGESTDTQPYEVAREVEDIHALIKEAGGSAMVFGMSSGAMLALHAAKAGLPITKLALYEVPLRADTDADRQEVQDYTEKLNTLLAADQRGDAVELAMITFGTPSEMVSGMKQSPVWSMFEAVAPTLAYDNAVMGKGTLPVDSLAEVTMPTLVIDGDASPAFMHQAADAVQAALPNATRSTLAGQSHAYEPAVLAPVVIDFFKS